MILVSSLTSELVIVQHECADLRDGNISVRIVNFYYENGVENELTNNFTNISLRNFGFFPLQLFHIHGKRKC